MDNDAQLVALLDGKLDEETGSRLLARIASDENLRNRYDALREAGSWLDSAFDWLLGTLRFRGCEQRFNGSAMGVKRCRLSLAFPSARWSSRSPSASWRQGWGLGSP
jgi:hypothetical protein